MSTKIYYAWRMPIERLTEFMDLLREVCFDSAVAFLESLPAASPLAPKPPWWAEAPDDIRDAYLQWSGATRYLSPYQNLDVFNIECGFDVWLHDDGLAYVIPWFAGNSMTAAAVEAAPEWAEEYSYWNNTDRPDHVTAAEWAARKKTWDAVCIGYDPDKYITRKLRHVILDTRNDVYSRVLLESALGRWKLDEWLRDRRRTRNKET